MTSIPAQAERATTTAEELVNRVTAISEIPADVAELARLHFLDALGVGLAASAVGPITSLVDSIVEPGECTLLHRNGANLRTTAATAALINGSLAHSLEYDDTHTGSVMHGSSVLAPAILAAAQSLAAQGKLDSTKIIPAFAIGWEVLIRLGLSAPSGFQQVGFQGSPVAGPLAGALAVGLLEGLTTEQLLHAVGVAVSFSAGNFTFLATGATSKAAQAGIASEASIRAVQLVKGGVTGGPGVLDGDRGFFGLYARDAEAANRFRESSHGLGKTWLLRDAAFKGVPCCHYLHPFIEAVSKAELPLTETNTHGEVVKIRCHVPAGQEAVIAEPWEEKQHIRSAAEARWSLPYVVALRAVRGAVTLDDFVGAADAEIIEFAEKIEWVPWHNSGYPERFPAKLDVEWSDGTVRTIEIADVDGNGSRPWSREQVVEKFTSNASSAGLSDPQVTELLHGILDVPAIDLGPLARLSGKN
ncbi:MAG: MmgE/PrpD family protein [Microbacterium sp.]|uniref:MmgE/PrpD family protein n=1 Tax=Microbacterium sp. TaxID=51671 RepID=UPI003F984B6B